MRNRRSLRHRACNAVEHVRFGMCVIAVPPLAVAGAVLLLGHGWVSIFGYPVEERFRRERTPRTA